MAVVVVHGAAAFAAVELQSRPYVSSNRASVRARGVVATRCRISFPFQAKRVLVRSSAVLATSLATGTSKSAGLRDVYGVGHRAARVRCESTAGSSTRQVDSSAAAPLEDSSTSEATKAESQEPPLVLGSNGGSNVAGGYSNGGGGGGEGGDGSSEGGNGRGDGSGPGAGHVVALLTKGWQDRVAADPQFVFKVLTEQIIGVTACVLGDMASRPNFGLNELDFVFSTLVVGSIVNFALMYLLAPTTADGVAAEPLPGFFARSPSGHMFEAGAYSVLDRVGTFVYKGVQFATVGFFAGCMGTAISNALLTVRKKLDPSFELQNSPPPTFLNAATWALHMGFSSNLRYQCLNGLDQILLKALSPNLFRALVFAIRGTNNVIGGSTFVMLAKVTGSQKAAGPSAESQASKEGEGLQATPAAS